METVEAGTMRGVDTPDGTMVSLVSKLWNDWIESVLSEWMLDSDADSGGVLYALLVAVDEDVAESWCFWRAWIDGRIGCCVGVTTGGEGFGKV